MCTGNNNKWNPLDLQQADVMTDLLCTSIIHKQKRITSREQQSVYDCTLTSTLIKWKRIHFCESDCHLASAWQVALLISSDLLWTHDTMLFLSSGVQYRFWNLLNQLCMEKLNWNTFKDKRAEHDNNSWSAAPSSGRNGKSNISVIKNGTICLCIYCKYINDITSNMELYCIYYL